MTDKKELVVDIFLENWKYQSPIGKRNVELQYASRGSFIATNNPSSFDCFYLIKNN